MKQTLLLALFLTIGTATFAQTKKQDTTAYHRIVVKLKTVKSDTTQEVVSIQQIDGQIANAKTQIIILQARINTLTAKRAKVLKMVKP